MIECLPKKPKKVSRGKLHVQDNRTPGFRPIDETGGMMRMTNNYKKKGEREDSSRAEEAMERAMGFYPG